MAPSSGSSLGINNNNNNNDERDFGSTKTLKEQSRPVNLTGSFNNLEMGHHNQSNGNIAPPLPPHRLCPAPPSMLRQPNLVSVFLIMIFLSCFFNGFKPYLLIEIDKVFV